MPHLRGKCMAESPVVWFSSSVDSVSSLQPPIRTVPSGEAQLQWDSLDPWRVCECFQLPPLKWTQVSESGLAKSEVCPPQASSPVWEWWLRLLGRSAREHQGEPSLWRTSTERSLAPLAASPPLTMIAAETLKYICPLSILNQSWHARYVQCFKISMN